jgi:hypothetical protein
LKLLEALPILLPAAEGVHLALEIPTSMHKVLDRIGPDFFRTTVELPVSSDDPTELSYLIIVDGKSFANGASLNPVFERLLMVVPAVTRADIE